VIATTILLVDDEDVIRKSFSRELRMDHYEVTAVSCGDDAINALENGQYDVVITDLMMPGLDGFGVLKAVKNRAPMTSVIILTGYGDMNAAIDALRLGADDFTLKPCEVEELTFRIQRCLEKRSLLQRLSQQNQLLEEEIRRRQQVEEQLHRAGAELEERVRERTAELSETNTALTVLLKKREADRTILGEHVLANATKVVEPFLDRLMESGLNEEQRTLVGILRANVATLTSPFASNFSNILIRLTPAEMQVANLVKQGKRTKEIAAIMHLSPGTINIHRKNIRKKLELTHQKTNLQTMLSINS
jgi:DNA-binding NarL/FixJ family response regulator